MTSDPPGFREFVIARTPRLLRTAWMLTGDAASAEDLLQTALARTWPHWERVASGHPEAYLRTVMVRTLSSWRSRRWTGETPTAFVPHDDADRSRIVRDHHDDAEDRLVLLAALQSLPTRQRLCVVLRYFEDLSLTDTAETMGCSVGTVKSQSTKGLAKLRDALATAGLTEMEQR